VAIIEVVGLADLEIAWEIGNSWRDQDFSIVDRTSFAVMRRLGIDHVASLDEHFSVFRFGAKRRLCRWCYGCAGSVKNMGGKRKR
jgi:uncharacterized protein